MHNITSATRSKYSDRIILTLAHHRAISKQIAGDKPTYIFAMTFATSNVMNGAVGGSMSGAGSGLMSGTVSDPVGGAMTA